MTPEVPPISALTMRFFGRVVRRYFRRHFRAVMAQHVERLTQTSGPLIVYANHSSWWDPMVGILLAQMLLPGRKHYAPMDAAALARYPILRKLGIFPVETTSARGAVQFLRTSEAILRDGGVLWVTPQGRFADTRAWPLAFKPGLAALVLRAPEATLLPMAVEYTFWDERLPEALVHVAPAVTMEAGVRIEEANKQLEAALSAAMLELQAASVARDAMAFRVLLAGGRGTGGWYALVRRVRSWFGRKPLQVDHTRRDG